MNVSMERRQNDAGSNHQTRFTHIYSEIEARLERNFY